MKGDLRHCNAALRIASPCDIIRRVPRVIRYAGQGHARWRRTVAGAHHGDIGFVGSHLAEYLLAETDWQVAGTVYGRSDNIAHLRDRLLLYPPSCRASK